MILLDLALVLGLALFAFTLWATRRAETNLPASGERIDADGARIHVTRRDPQGIARASILLVHGASGNQADMMLALGDRLVARGFGVVAVDRPGHGWSDRLQVDAASPAAQASAIRSALERAGVREALVVGHSWAGSLAANLLIDHPDFCIGGVLLAPVTHPWPRGIRWYYKIAATPVAGWLFAHLLVTPLGLLLMQPSVRGVFAPDPPPRDYAQRTGAALAIRPEAFRANARDIVGLRAFLEKQAPRMRGIARPVAIVSGDRDGVVLTERHSFASAREIPGATLQMLRGVGHSPHWSRPDVVVDEIEGVFERAQSARAIRPEYAAMAPASSSQ